MAVGEDRTAERTSESTCKCRCFLQQLKNWSCASSGYIDTIMSGEAFFNF